ncbi:ABC transporter ATP-binding protein [Mycoplasmatota bacterium]|nr:ABC transporter ATP-binding protein [Mycoplasmatota bacterium]
MINVKDLKFSYRHDGTYQVDGISFEVKEGETLGFLGPNGAGKSTVQKILIGLLPMQEGEAIVDGVAVKDYNSKFFNKIGVSFEFPNAYKKLSALENMEYYASLFDVPTQDPRMLLKLVGLEDAVDKKVGDFSKGMLQRFVMARSMLNKPEVWFLDEPLSGLDPQTSQNIKNVIKQEKETGTTIFLTTHDMHVAEELCDRVAFIESGKIIVIDSPRNLKLKYGEKVVNIEYKESGKTKTEKLALGNEKDADRVSEILKTKEVETVHSGEATLEDIFIELTGRGLK